MRGRAMLIALVAVATLGCATGTASAAAVADYSRIPLWVYGHSFTTNPGTINTPGQEWMPKLAAALGSPSWRTFGVGSSRIIDTYSDIARRADRQPMAGSAWDGSRHGVVVIQSELNDAINPAFHNTLASLPMTATTAADYGQTLQATLALLASSSHEDWSNATGRGAWKSAPGAPYLGGALTYTTVPGAYREMRVDVGASGTVWVITWDVSDLVKNERTAATAISVDGRLQTTLPARTAPWAAQWSRRAGGSLRTVGPRATALTGLTPGRHTIRVAKADHGDAALYLDQLTVQSASPVPVVLVKDPDIVPGSSWVASNADRVNSNLTQLHSQIDRVIGSPLFRNVTVATFDGIQPDDHGYDGTHLSDQGMTFEASRIEAAIRAELDVYTSTALYQ